MGSYRQRARSAACPAALAGRPRTVLLGFPIGGLLDIPRQGPTPLVEGLKVTGKDVGKPVQLPP